MDKEYTPMLALKKKKEREAAEAAAAAAGGGAAGAGASAAASAKPKVAKTTPAEIRIRQDLSDIDIPPFVTLS